MNVRIHNEALDIKLTPEQWRRFVRKGGAEWLLRQLNKPARSGALVPSTTLAMDWLNARLGSNTVAVSVIVEEAASFGHNLGALHRAKRRLGVLSERQGFGRNAVWYWTLPRAEPDEI